MKKKQLSTEEAKRIAKIRWDKITPENRSQIAKHMNKIRWSRVILSKDKEAEIPSKDNK